MDELYGNERAYLLMVTKKPDRRKRKSLELGKVITCRYLLTLWSKRVRTLIVFSMPPIRESARGERLQKDGGAQLQGSTFKVKANARLQHERRVKCIFSI